jgi:hypothetical protein
MANSPYYRALLETFADQLGPSINDFEHPLNYNKFATITFIWKRVGDKAGVFTQVYENEVASVALMLSGSDADEEHVAIEQFERILAAGDRLRARNLDLSRFGMSRSVNPSLVARIARGHWTFRFGHSQVFAVIAPGVGVARLPDPLQTNRISPVHPHPDALQGHLFAQLSTRLLKRGRDPHQWE